MIINRIQETQNLLPL